MSSHGRRIFGATLRRTCGIPSLGTKAPLYPFRLPIAAPLSLSTSSQVTDLIYRSLPQPAALCSARRNIPIKQAAATSPLHLVAPPVLGLWPRLSQLSWLPSKLHAQTAQSRWLGPKFQLRRIGSLPRPQLCKRRAFIRGRHVRGASSEPKDQSAKEKSLSRLRSKSKTSPETPVPPRIAPSPVAGKNLVERLPKISHIQRPSKEELLAAATGFWSRLKVRFKWFSIRSGRPFNIDEISAFFSWILLGHVLWIILGTTTFFSLAILAVNTVFAQGSSSSVTKMTSLADHQQKHWLDGLVTI